MGKKGANSQILFTRKYCSIHILISKFRKLVQTMKKDSDIRSETLQLIRQLSDVQSLHNGVIYGVQQCSGARIATANLGPGKIGRIQGEFFHFARKEIRSILAEKEENVSETVTQMK